MTVELVWSLIKVWNFHQVGLIVIDQGSKGVIRNRMDTEKIFITYLNAYLSCKKLVHKCSF